MPQKPIAQQTSAHIRGWITRAYKRNLFQLYPRAILSPIPALFTQLSQEGNHLHGIILIRFWQIDLITEDNQPFIGILRTQEHPFGGLIKLTVVFKLFHNEVGPSSGGKIDENHFTGGKTLQSGHQSHGFSGPGWPTDNKRSVLTHPAA